MIDYDRRQLREMLNQLDAFDSGHVDLNGLISSLESLSNALQAVPGEWKLDFGRQWGVLEQIYSVAVVEELPLDSKENRKRVDVAIQRVRVLILQALV